MEIPGFASLPSKYPVDKTLERLQSILKEKGVAVFAVVDHSGEAAKVGIEMRPTKLVVFGNPKGGTPLMIAAPTVAIDLPLKALVWEDSDGDYLDFLQLARVFAATPPLPARADQEHRRSNRIAQSCRRVTHVISRIGLGCYTSCVATSSFSSIFAAEAG